MNSTVRPAVVRSERSLSEESTAKEFCRGLANYGRKRYCRYFITQEDPPLLYTLCVHTIHRTPNHYNVPHMDWIGLDWIGLDWMVVYW